jgi:hypothetical protein
VLVPVLPGNLLPPLVRDFFVPVVSVLGVPLLVHVHLCVCKVCKITSVVKVKTDIITSIAEIPIGQPVILLKMYVKYVKYAKTFKTNVIVFICIKHHIMTSHSIRVTKLILTISLL